MPTGAPHGCSSHGDLRTMVVYRFEHEEMLGSATIVDSFKGHKILTNHFQKLTINHLKAIGDLQNDNFKKMQSEFSFNSEQKKKFITSLRN